MVFTDLIVPNAVSKVDGNVLVTKGGIKSYKTRTVLGAVTVRADIKSVVNGLFASLLGCLERRLNVGDRLFNLCLFGIGALVELHLGNCGGNLLAHRSAHRKKLCGINFIEGNEVSQMVLIKLFLV